MLNAYKHNTVNKMQTHKLELNSVMSSQLLLNTNIFT